MVNKTLNRLFIDKNASIKDAIRIIDRGVLGIAFVVDSQKKLFGVVSDGEIRRAILRGVNIKNSIKTITNKKPIVIELGAGREEILRLRKREEFKKKMQPAGSLKIPVLDGEGRVEDVMFLYDDAKKSIQSLDYKLKKDSKEIEQGLIKKVLLIGGAGYLGSVLSRKLLKEGYKVIVFDNLTYGDEGIAEIYKDKHFEFIKGDVRNISQTIEAIRGADAVIDLAAIVGDPACALDPKETIEVNYLATKAIAEACKYNQINKFLFTSTCSVYGAGKNAKDRLHEESPLNPVSLYAETKLKSEDGILSLSDENFSPTIFRFGTLYGVSPRMRFDLVVNTLTARAVADKKITIFGGNQWRPNLEVSDAAGACLKWLQSPIIKSGNETFNVGGNSQNCKIIQIGEMVKNVIPDVEMETKQEIDDPRDYNVSFDKIEKVLGFRPEKTIDQGIREMKELLEGEKIKDFNHPVYSNCRFLSQ
ncbi:MAG: NAD-dependent epimerase/dehydratase family protein [bacterium]|nr:NAD-dependent epimerase/dehydratase family protein [bacterium]